MAYEPVNVAVFPLMKNGWINLEMQKKIYDDLQKEFS